MDIEARQSITAMKRCGCMYQRRNTRNSSPWTPRTNQDPQHRALRGVDLLAYGGLLNLEKPMKPNATLPTWTRPDSYMGRDWHGWLIAPVSRHRDSDILTLSNWDVVVSHLDDLMESDAGLSGDWIDPYTGEECGPFEIVRERHCLVGWVEWIAIHPDAAVLRQYALEVSEALEAYPVLDEDHFCEVEHEAAIDAFKHEADDFRERVLERFPALRARLEALDTGDLWNLYMAADLPEPYTSDNGGTYVRIEWAADALDADVIDAALAPIH